MGLIFMEMRKHFLKRYLDWKIGTKMLFSFLFGAILPILLIQSISSHLNTHYLTEKVNQLMVNNLTQIAERVNLTLEVYTNLLYQIYIDDQIIDNINILLDEDSNQKAAAYNQINNRIKQYNSSTKGIRCISVVCDNGTSVTYDFETGSTLDNLWSGYQDLRQITPYQNAEDQASMVITPTAVLTDGKGQVHLFHISKRIYDLDNLERGSIATVIMSVDEKVLETICQESSNETGNNLNNINFILDQNRTVISYPDETFSGITITPKISITHFVKVSGLLQNKKTAVNQYYDEKTGWTFYNVYDENYMLKDIKKSQNSFILIGIVALIFSGLLIIITVRKLAASIGSVIKGMKQIQSGNLDVVVPVESKDEIGQIADNFNDMTDKIKLLIQEVTQATRKQKDAEIHALEAQINPHFLYNTLDSINWMAIEKEEYEISKMLINLGVILRYSINKSNEMATIREIADWIVKYTSLQKMRFNNAFTCNLSVDEKAYPVKMYKLLLQPFIENSITHGFKGIEYGGVIRIDIQLDEKEDFINIIIEDNGHGMAPELVKEFNNRDKVITDDKPGIGLQNSFTRMDMYYGKEASWNVSSVEEMGTIITINIPIIERER